MIFSLLSIMYTLLFDIIKQQVYYSSLSAADETTVIRAASNIYNKSMYSKRAMLAANK